MAPRTGRRPRQLYNLCQASVDVDDLAANKPPLLCFLVFVPVADYGEISDISDAHCKTENANRFEILSDFVLSLFVSHQPLIKDVHL